MGIKFRLTPAIFQEMQKHLTHDTTVEQGCFLLCSEASAKDDCILIAKGLIPLEKSDYVVQKFDQLSFSPSTMLRAVRLAKSYNASLCFVHTHPMSTKEVEFSQADGIGNIRTFDFFNRMLPGKTNSALVFSGDMTAVSGRTYQTASSWNRIHSVSVAGNPYQLTTTGIDTSRHLDTSVFDRHALLLGKEGRDLLSDLTIAIVGLGGIGSVVATELAHCGFGNLALIDHDILEDSNRPRIIGSKPSDVTNGTAKVDIASRYISSTMPECNVQAFHTNVEDPLVREELISADAIIVCTDSAKSRAYVNEICHRYYVPTLDLGVEFVASPDGKIDNEVGKVNLVMPGTPCLFCVGHVSSEMILVEELPVEEVRKRAAEGYVRNIHLPQPSMMPFNGEIASRGIQLLVSQFTGLAPVSEQTYEQRSFLGLKRRKLVRIIAKHHDKDCPYCIPGGVLGKGDNLPLCTEDEVA